MEIESLSRLLLPKMHFLFNGFFALSSAPSLLHLLLLLCFSNGNDRIFRWLKIWISKDASVLLPLPSSLCYANRDSWVYLGWVNKTQMERQLWRLIKESQFLSFWGLQTLFLQKSRICNWHLCTQRLEISQKGSFYSCNYLLPYDTFFVDFQTLCLYWLSLNYWKMQRVDVELIRQQFPLKSASAALQKRGKKNAFWKKVFVFSHPILFAMIKYRRKVC